MTNTVTVSEKDNPKQTINENEFEQEKVDLDDRNYFKSASGYIIGGVVVLIVVLIFIRRRFT